VRSVSFISNFPKVSNKIVKNCKSYLARKGETRQRGIQVGGASPDFRSTHHQIAHFRPTTTTTTWQPWRPPRVRLISRSIELIQVHAPSFAMNGGDQSYDTVIKTHVADALLTALFLVALADQGRNCKRDITRQ